MSDNVTFGATPATPPSGTVVSTEEVTTLNGSVVSAQQVQRVAAAIRTADGTAIDLPGDSAQGLDVDVTRLPALPAGTNNIGDVDIASLPNEGQQSMAGSISVAVASDQSAIPVSDNGGSLTVDGPLTDVQLRATAVPVSGPLTDAELRALPVPVSGTLGISGAVEVANDAGNPLPVSASSLPLPTGASTSANQATSNTSLASIDSKLVTEKTADFDTGAETDTVAMQGIALPKSGGAVAGGTSADPLRTDPTGTTTQPISAASLPLPTGAATSANQSTANTALSAIQTAVEILDNAVSGSEIQADIVAPLPTGDNNIGNVDVVSLPSIPAGSNNIGDVDVLTLPTIPTGDNAIGRVKLTDGTDVADVLDLANSNALATAIVDGSGNQITSFGGGTQYTEGDTDASVTGTAVMWEDSGDTLRPVSAAKPLPVNIVAGAGSGGTAQADESAFTEGTTNFTPIGGVLNDTITSDPTEDQAAAARITAKRGLHVNLRNNAGAEISPALESGNLALLAAAIKTDDDGFTPQNSSVMVAGFTVDEATPVGAGEGNVAAARMSLNRNVYTQIRDSAGNERGAQVTVANALKVDGSGVTQPVSTLNSTANGTIAANGQSVTFLVNGISTAAVQVTGTWDGTIQIEGTVDDSNWLSITGYAGQVGQTNIQATNTLLLLPVAGLRRIRLRSSFWDSGTANINFEGGAGTSVVIVPSVSFPATQAVNVGQVAGTATATGTGVVTAGTQRVVIATDQAQLTNALKVDGSAVTQPVSGSVTANAGTNLNTSALALETTQSAIKTATELIDDSVHADNATRGKSLAMGAVFDDVAPASITENNAGYLRMTANRGLHVSVQDSLPAGTANIGDVDIASIAAGDNNIGNVDVVTMPNVTLAAGTNTNEVVGDAAEDAALAGNPVRQGVRASTAIPTAVSADNDIVTPWANRSGAQVMTQAPHVGLNSDPWNQLHECAQFTTTQTSAILIDAAAGEKIVITDIQIQVGGTTAGTVQVYFGTGAYSRGTNRAIFDGEFAPSATLKPGVVMKGPFIAGANGDDVRVTTSAAINPITISIWYYVVS